MISELCHLLGDVLHSRATLPVLQQVYRTFFKPFTRRRVSATLSGKKKKNVLVTRISSEERNNPAPTWRGELFSFHYRHPSVLTFKVDAVVSTARAGKRKSAEEGCRRFAELSSDGSCRPKLSDNSRSSRGVRTKVMRGKVINWCFLASSRSKFSYLFLNQSREGEMAEYPFNLSEPISHVLGIPRRI